MHTKNIELVLLKSWLDGRKDLLLIDVLPPEYFAEKHIEGAVNAPVYELAFLEYIQKLTSDKQKTIVVYNERPHSLAAADAAMKLAKAGYKDVYEFPGGLSQWEAAGYPLERGSAPPAVTLADGEYQIEVEKSIVGWTGRNAKHAHQGKITPRSGTLVVKDETIADGEIVLNMSTIKDEDLTDDTWRGVLESHLRSPDFFAVEDFPLASFRLDSAKRIVSTRIGTSNFAVEGRLNIKGVSNPISLVAMIVPVADGSVHGQAHFDFDRTLWNIRYGSEKYFEKLGMHLVNDIVSVEIFLVAIPANNPGRHNSGRYTSDQTS